MSRALGMVLGLAAAGAAGALYLELRAAPPRSDLRPPPHLARATATAAVAEPDDNELTAILARPLFNPSRRPVAAAAIADAAMEVPRLAGIVIDRSGRSAIFAAVDHPKPLVLREGGRLGGWSLRAIEASAVTLAGPDGTRVLHLGFAKQAAPQPSPQQPALPPRPARAAWAGGDR